MAMILSGRELTQIASASRKAVSCNSVTELQNEAVAMLDRLVGTSVCLFLLDPEQRSGTDRRMVGLGVDSLREQIYHQRYQSNPYAQWIRSVRRGWRSPIAIPNEIADQARGTSFYQEFMRPLGIHHSMAVALVRDNRYLGVIGLFRPEDSRGFNQRDAMKAALLAPTIQAVLERNLQEEREAQWSWMIKALDTIPTADGVVVLDSYLRVHYRNPIAAEILRKLRDSTERDSDDPSMLPRLLRTQCASFASRPDAEAISRFQLAVPRTGYTAEVELHRLTDTEARSGYVIRLKAESATVSHLERMRSLGLTAREIDVVNAAGAGLTNQQIADHLCISFFTVQSHLKSIYSKLGVHNRAGFLRRIASA